MISVCLSPLKEKRSDSTAASSPHSIMFLLCHLSDLLSDLLSISVFFLLSDGNQCSGGSRKRSRKRSEEEEEESTWDSCSEVKPPTPTPVGSLTISKAGSMLH